MPAGEIDVYTVREDDYRLMGVRIATQEEYDQRTKEMEALEAAAGKESSYVQEAVDTETGSSIHMFAYDEETVTEANDGSATETAVVTEDVVSNYAEQKEMCIRDSLDLVPKDGRRNLFPVGRLDKDTEGLLLITDDGQLAHRLLSPKKHVDKTYFAVTEGKVVPEDIEKIRLGVDMGDEEPTLAGKLEMLSTWKEDDDRKKVEGESGAVIANSNAAGHKADPEGSIWCSEILLTIHEGRFHQVKRMMEAVGKKVIYLKRISMGALTLQDDMPKGKARELTPDELAALKCENS